jgi:hypothetical protein
MSLRDDMSPFSQPAFLVAISSAVALLLCIAFVIWWV